MDSHKKIIAGIHSLEPLPAVCTRVMKLAGEESVVPSELVEVIQADIGITTKVLRICNSAYYGFAREVGSLEEAGNRLGVDSLVNLVLTACSGSYFKGIGGGSASRAKELWERSMSNALSSSLLATIQGDVDKSAAYTAGLLQDIGEVVLERFLPSEANEIRGQVLHGHSRIEVENDLLGEDHATIGARLAEQWNFPEALVDAIRHHHAPTSAVIAPDLACTVHLGDLITTTLAEEPDGIQSLTSLTEDVLKMVGLDTIGFAALEERVQSELDRARELIAG